MEKRPKKFIPWQHHPHLDVTVQKPNSLCHHAKDVADIVVVVIIFIEGDMERPTSHFLPAIVGEEEEEPNPQYHKTWHVEN
jgi:hypothetical protein